jgi:uncharacterized DUF497 family protein
MYFEWDERKKECNILKHGIDFADAALIFLDYDRIETFDDRKNYGEDRYRTIGIAGGMVLNVVYTIRKANYRIISARKANKNEKEMYLLNR